MFITKKEYDRIIEEECRLRDEIETLKYLLYKANVNISELKYDNDISITTMIEEELNVY